MITIFAIIITFGIVMCLLAYFIYHLAKSGAKFANRLYELEMKSYHRERDFVELNTKYFNLAHTLEETMKNMDTLELHKDILFCRADATSDFMLRWIPKLEAIESKLNKKQKVRK